MMRKDGANRAAEARPLESVRLTGPSRAGRMRCKTAPQYTGRVLRAIA